MNSVCNMGKIKLSRGSRFPIRQMESQMRGWRIHIQDKRFLFLLLQLKPLRH